MRLACSRLIFYVFHYSVHSLVTKLLNGAIFRLKNIFTKLLLPPKKFAALGRRLVRLVVKPALVTHTQTSTAGQMHTHTHTQPCMAGQKHTHTNTQTHTN